MADNLTAAQRAAFSSGSYNLADFRQAVTLGHATKTDYEIPAERIVSFGETRIAIFNVASHAPGDLEFPAYDITVINDDGYFSPLNDAANVWAGAITEWTLTKTNQEKASTGSWADVGPSSVFRVFDVATRHNRTAIISAAHFLSAEFAKVWTRDDSLSFDWNGVTHRITLD